MKNELLRKDRLVTPALSGAAVENEVIDTTPRIHSDVIPAWAQQMWLTLLSEEAAFWPAEEVKAFVDGARTSLKAAG